MEGEMAETEDRHVEEIGKAEQEMEAAADEMSERSEQLDEQIDGAKQTHAKAQADASVPTAAGDWEDTEPADSTGEDAAGFDDPEDLDLDDEDLDDEPADDDED
jgi:phage shock protein A